MKRFTLPFALLAIALCGFNTLNAQTNVPAVVSGNQTWTKAASPYVISQNTVISAGVTIKIEPGVVVRSTNPTYQLTVDGALEATGSQTAGMVTFDSIQIQFGANAVPYDASAGIGNQFNWCRFNGPMNGNPNTTALRTGIRIGIDRCIFNGHRTALHLGIGGVDSMWVTNSYFSSYKPIHSFGTQLKCFVLDNTFQGCTEMYFYGALQFERNTVDGLDRFSCYAYRNVDINCNSFSHFDRPLSLTFYGTGKIETFNFMNNHLDSFKGQMIVINRDNYISKAKFNNNNFLHTDGNTKVAINGANVDQSTSTRIDFTRNYWGATTTTQIEDMVHDYGDDIQIYGKVDFGSFATSKIARKCPSCEAIFTITPDSSDRKKYKFTGSVPPIGGSAEYLVYDKSGTSSTSLNGSTVTYRFNSGASNNRVIYMVYDAAGNLCDSSLQNIPCMASYYVGKDTNNKFKLFLINNSRGTDSKTTYLWTFGDGTTSTKKSPNHKYANFGKYEVCLSIANPVTGCESRFCDSIGLDSNGNLLKASGFEINVIDESELLGLSPQRLENDRVHVYPNPTRGNVVIQVDAGVRDMEILVRNAFGQMLQHVEVNTNEAELDLSTYSNGIYFIETNIEDQKVIRKIILTK